MEYTHVDNSFAAPLHGPHFPERLKYLSMVLERYGIHKKDFNDFSKTREGPYEYRSFSYPYTILGQQWLLGLKFQNPYGLNGVSGEMLILISDTKSHWLFWHRLERPLAVYAWGYSEELMNEHIQKYTSALENWKSKNH